MVVDVPWEKKGGTEWIGKITYELIVTMHKKDYFERQKLKRRTTLGGTFLRAENQYFKMLNTCDNFLISFR